MKACQCLGVVLQCYIGDSVLKVGNRQVLIQLGCLGIGSTLVMKGGICKYTCQGTKLVVSKGRAMVFFCCTAPSKSPSVVRTTPMLK